MTLKTDWLKSYYIQIQSEYLLGALEDVKRDVIRMRKMETETLTPLCTHAYG